MGQSKKLVYVARYRHGMLIDEEFKMGELLRKREDFSKDEYYCTECGVDVLAVIKGKFPHFKTKQGKDHLEGCSFDESFNKKLKAFGAKIPDGAIILDFDHFTDETITNGILTNSPDKSYFSDKEANITSGVLIGSNTVRIRSASILAKLLVEKVNNNAVFKYFVRQNQIYILPGYSKELFNNTLNQNTKNYIVFDGYLETNNLEEDIVLNRVKRDNSELEIHLQFMQHRKSLLNKRLSKIKDKYNYKNVKVLIIARALEANKTDNTSSIIAEVIDFTLRYDHEYKK
ncbi:hypothetical protein [Sporosarcina sp. SG10008]|uniref:hypothetical protein n=1 Tax=Sporosarcina sp. SG10008 TaxID=3373103 RepID=UPI0037DD3107